MSLQLVCGCRCLRRRTELCGSRLARLHARSESHQPRCGSQKPLSAKVPAAAFLIALHVQDALHNSVGSASFNKLPTKFIERPKPSLCRYLRMPFYLGHASFLPLRILGESGRTRLHFKLSVSEAWPRPDVFAGCHSRRSWQVRVASQLGLVRQHKLND